MKSYGFGFLQTVVSMAVLVVFAGCRDQAEISENYSHVIDHGDGGLTPVAPMSYSASGSIEGRADLKPLPENPISPEELASGVNRQERAAIEDVVKVYNEITVEEAWDELPGYFVARQQDAVKTLNTFYETTIASVEGLAGATKEKLPDAFDAVEKLSKEMKPKKVSISDIKRVNDTQITAKWSVEDNSTPIPPGMDVINFSLVDDEWFMEMPFIDMMAQMVPMLTQFTTQIDAITQQVNSGQIEAAALTEQIEMMLAMTGGPKQ